MFWDNLAIYHVRFSFYDSLTFWRPKIIKKINQKIKKFLPPQKNDFECKIDVFGHKWSQIYCLIELRWKNAFLQSTGSHFLASKCVYFYTFLEYVPRSRWISRLDVFQCKILLIYMRMMISRCGKIQANSKISYQTRSKFGPVLSWKCSLLG